MTLTDEVLASFDDTRDERLRRLLQGLVRHLHAYAREVGLTQREWETAIDFLTGAGRITDERRQEFILLSDVLGMSALVTHIFVAGDPHLARDAVFGVKDSLIVPAQHHPAGPGPDASERTGPWASMAFDLVLVPVG